MLLPALALSLLLAEPDGAVAAGRPAPGFSLRTLNPDAAGAPWVRLEALVGPAAEDAGAKVVLLSFFASWCGPCKKELPFLVALDLAYRPKGLRVVSVDIDGDEAGIQAARELVAAAKVVHPVGTDRFQILARRYLGEKAPLPSAFLVRRDGTIARVDRGYTDDAGAFLEAAVRAELGLPPQPGGAAHREHAQPGRH
jgi:thiol-disulfide isomerase/thioredoxin